MLFRGLQHGDGGCDVEGWRGVVKVEGCSGNVSTGPSFSQVAKRRSIPGDIDHLDLPLSLSLCAWLCPSGLVD